MRQQRQFIDSPGASAQFDRSNRHRAQPSVGNPHHGRIHNGRMLAQHINYALGQDLEAPAHDRAIMPSAMKDISVLINHHQISGAHPVRPHGRAMHFQQSFRPARHFRAAFRIDGPYLHARHGKARAAALAIPTLRPHLRRPADNRPAKFRRAHSPKDRQIVALLEPLLQIGVEISRSSRHALHARHVLRRHIGVHDHRDRGRIEAQRVGPMAAQRIDQPIDREALHQHQRRIVNRSAGQQAHAPHAPERPDIDLHRRRAA